MRMATQKTNRQTKNPTQQITHIGENMEKLEPFCTVSGEVKWYSHRGKQYSNTQKIKDRFTIWCSNSTSGYILPLPSPKM